jgi:TetR/AcrR family transcriptional regulator
LQGENDRLRGRMRQFFDRIETQLRQILREGVARQEIDSAVPLTAAANLLLAAAEGRVHQFVRSEFKSKPTLDWNDQWSLLAAGVFV